MTREQDRPGTSPIVHPPVVALIFVVIAHFLGEILPLPFSAPAVLRAVGLAMSLVGFLLGLAAFLEFRKARTTLDPHGAATELVTSGIYRYTRNPIYLGFLLLVMGLPLYSGLYWGLVLAPLYILLMDRLIIRHEEAYLERTFGHTYNRYTTRVRRWV